MCKIIETGAKLALAVTAQSKLKGKWIYTYLSISFFFLFSTAQAVDLISNPNFETPLMEFSASSSESIISLDSSTPLSGKQSASIRLAPWNRIFFEKKIPWGSIINAKSLSLKAKLKSASILLGKELKFAPVVYYRDKNERAEAGQYIQASSQQVIEIDQTLNVNASRALDRVYFWIHNNSAQTLDFSLDEVQLSAELVTDSESPNPQPPTPPDVNPPPVAGSHPLISDPGFESASAHEIFQSSNDKIIIESSTSKVISGKQSVRVVSTPWGRVFFEQKVDWNANLKASQLNLNAKLKLEQIASSGQLEVTPIVYYRDANESVSKPFIIKSDAANNGVIEFAQSLVLDKDRSIDRIYYWIKLLSGESAEYLLDELTLDIAISDYSVKPDSGGGSSKPKPEVKLRELNIQVVNDLSANGKAANAFVKDIAIQIKPHQELINQGVQRVSFGLPLAPGSLLDTQQVSVFDSQGQEVPIYVKSLAQWNQMPPQSLLCPSYQAQGNPGHRSVLIQFDSQFDNQQVQDYRVRINQKRTQELPDLVPIEQTFRVVNDGSYEGHDLAQNIIEPKILTAIDPQYLQCTHLISLSEVAGGNSFLANADKAQDDFFYTAINEFFGRNVAEKDHINYLSDTASYWLYDRPQAFFNNYFSNGNMDSLREAFRATDHFRQNLYSPDECKDVDVPACIGYFKLKNPAKEKAWKDAKYSNNESFVSAYLLTGHKHYLQPIPHATMAVMQSVDFDLAVITERHRAIALLAATLDYELSQDSDLLSYINHAVDVMYQRQNTALVGDTINGCFNYSPEGGDIASFSPWMSSLLANALLRTYQATNDERIPAMLVNLAQCLSTRALYRDNELHRLGFGELLLPYYIGRSYGEKDDLDGTNPYTSMEHAIDVAIPIALGAYFSGDSTQQQQFIEDIKALLNTHSASIAYWTRDTPERPIYRLSPPRKYAWQYKNKGVLSKVLNALKVK